MGRKQKYTTPEERRAARAASRATWYEKKKKDPAWREKHRQRSKAGMRKGSEAHAEKYFRFGDHLRKKRSEFCRQLGLRAIALAQLDRPALKFIDPLGRRLADDERSAEELIRDFLKQNKALQKKGSHVAPEKSQK